MNLKLRQHDDKFVYNSYSCIWREKQGLGRIYEIYSIHKKREKETVNLADKVILYLAMDLSKRGNNVDWVHFSHLASAVRIVFLNLAGLELSDISAKWRLLF